MGKSYFAEMQEELIKTAAAAGAEAAMKRIEKERNKEAAERKDRRFRNTKLLLSNYRDFKGYAENAVYSAEQAEDVVNILDLMWDPNNRSDQIVESIKKSAIRTKIIMTHIDGMLNVYEKICEHSKNPAEKRRYFVLQHRYIADEVMTADELAEKFSVEPRTIYLDIDIAIERMSKLIFGIDFLSDKRNS